MPSPWDRVADFYLTITRELEELPIFKKVQPRPERRATPFLDSEMKKQAAIERGPAITPSPFGNRPTTPLAPGRTITTPRPTPDARPSEIVREGGRTYKWDGQKYNLVDVRGEPGGGFAPSEPAPVGFFQRNFGGAPGTQAFANALPAELMKVFGPTAEAAQQKARNLWAWRQGRQQPLQAIAAQAEYEQNVGEWPRMLTEAVTDPLMWAVPGATPLDLAVGAVKLAGRAGKGFLKAGAETMIRETGGGVPQRVTAARVGKRVKPPAMREALEAELAKLPKGLRENVDYIPPERLTIRENVNKKGITQDVLVDKTTGKDIVAIGTRSQRDKYLTEGYQPQFFTVPEGHAVSYKDAIKIKQTLASGKVPEAPVPARAVPAPAARAVTGPMASQFKEGLNARSVFEGGEVRPDLGVSWRSMGPVEYQRLVSGESIGGVKPGTKGQYWSWFPSRASANVGTSKVPKYLVEVNVPWAEGEALSRPATLSDVTGVWKSEGKEWVRVKVPAAPAAEAAPAAQVAKQPWQMTRAEVYEKAKALLTPGAEGKPFTAERTALLNKQVDYHKTLVSEALAEGKPVPPEVLADYPGLAAKAPVAAAVSAEQVRTAAIKILQEANLPPVPEGYVRLYRGERGTFGRPPVPPEGAPMSAYGAPGRWFSHKIEHAFARGPDLYYVDVPEAIAREAGEGRIATYAELPSEWATRAKPVVAAQPTPPVVIPREIPAAAPEAARGAGAAIPTKLRPLAEEAVKYDTFDAFETAFLRDIKHGRYYHITDNPNFTIDPLRGPRDMSSLAGEAIPDKGKLMITSDLSTWADEYKGTRQYVAIIDMSKVPKEQYRQINRGFGNEFFVDDPTNAKVIKVTTIAEAKRDARLHQTALEQTIRGSDDLKAFFNKVKTPAATESAVARGGLEPTAPTGQARALPQPATPPVAPAPGPGAVTAAEKQPRIPQHPWAKGGPYPSPSPIVPGQAPPVKPPAVTGAVTPPVGGGTVPPAAGVPAAPVITPAGRLWLPEPPRTTPAFMAATRKAMGSAFRGKEGAFDTIEEAHQMVLKSRDMGTNTVPYVQSYIAQIGDVVKEFGVDAGGLATKVANPGGRSLAINDVLSNFTHYTLTPTQLELAKRTGFVYKEALKLAKSYGVNISELGGPDEFWQYIARRVKSKLNPVTGQYETPPGAIGGFKMGAKISAQKERVFEEMSQGLDLGFLYENPDQVMANHIRGIYRLIGNKQAENLVKPLTRAITETTPLQFGERAVAEPALKQRAAAVEIANAIDKIFTPEQEIKALRVASEISGAMVGQVAALDISAPFIQGLPVLGHDLKMGLQGKASTVWLKSYGNMWKTVKNPESIVKFRNEHADLYKRFIEAGGLTGQSEFVSGVGTVQQALAKVPKVGMTLSGVYRQTYGRMGQAYSDFLEIARVKLFEQMEPVWQREGKNIFELGAVVNRMTGTVSAAARGVGPNRRAAERIAAFAPNYLRASLLLVRDLISRGGPAREVQASIAAMLGVGAAVYYATAKLLGQEPLMKPWPRKFGGNGAAAFTIGIGDTRVGLGSWMYGMIKTLAEVGAMAVDEPGALVVWNDRHPIVKFAKSKRGPVIGLAWELATGKDFFGRRFDSPGDYLLRIAEALVPIAGQSMITQEPKGSAAQVVAEVMGGRAYPYSLLSRWTDEGVFKVYNAIPTSDIELAKLRKANPFKKIPNREGYRTLHPDIDAKLFISGQIGTIQARSIGTTLNLIRELKINPDVIRGIQLNKAAKAKWTKAGIKDNSETTPTDTLVRLLAQPTSPQSPPLPQTPVVPAVPTATPQPTAGPGRTPVATPTPWPTQTPQPTMSKSVQQWREIRPLLNSNLLLALDKVWNGGSLTADETRQLRELYTYHDFGAPTFDIWLRQTLKQSQQQAAVESRK